MMTLVLLSYDNESIEEESDHNVICSSELKLEVF